MATFVDMYAAVKRHRSFSMRERLRGMALDVLSALGNDKEMGRPRIQFLYIHHTFKDELPALELLLDYLEAHYTIISHTDAVEKIWRDDIDRPYLSISSDDGFKNNLQAGEVLAKRGISACFFINPALIGEADFDKIKNHCAERLHFPPIEFLNWSEVELLQKMGHEIGSHTMDHMRISEHAPSEVDKDIRQTHEILMQRCGRAAHFAWPYGLFSDFNEAARKSVFNAGFTSCSSAERGAHFSVGKAAKEQLCIRRDHIILDWKLAHIKYFLRKNAGRGDVRNNEYSFAR